MATLVLIGMGLVLAVGNLREPWIWGVFGVLVVLSGVFLLLVGEDADRDAQPRMRRPIVLPTRFYGGLQILWGLTLVVVAILRKS
jgi:cadmium resistance protein CadD (predicted permease)